MLKQFFQNAKQPRGFWGRSMLSKMNAGHTPLSHWALPQLRLAEDSHVLDIGCGGGANLLRLLKRCPQGQIDGLDYAAESVRYSRKKVGRALGEHCRVTQGDAGQLP
ncbi:MAG: class I SAM-dependent methyltransferase, partial [Oscillospiraceae bacterium]|nr:class I SAM-dependent methyltransferase [Oscillospiraceae bacterium]